ncbi:MAG TPA: hypothetical protein VGO22_07260 [Pseudorhizobium sp.]|jgi:hypothetical protein|nr:hypothetical protein [Pseudorhizobium sp.]
MPSKHINLTLVTPTQTQKSTLSIEDAREVLAQAVPAWELQEALEFLEMETMAEGFYIGSDWTISFRDAED